MVINIPEYMKFLPVESEILGFRILNLAQKIRNLANDWSPETGIQCLESGIHSVESRI